MSLEEPKAKQPPWRVGLVEDDERYRAHTLRTLQADERIVEALAWESGEACLRDAALGRMDMLLLDISLPGMNGVELAGRLRARFEELPFVMLSSVEQSETIFEALKRGACGYLLKTDLDDIVPMVELVMAGQAVMSPRIALHVVRYFQPRARSNAAHAEIGRAHV